VQLYDELPANADRLLTSAVNLFDSKEAVVALFGPVGKGHD
jgi:hypothetical protein